jgi:hypothetical protein
LLAVTLVAGLLLAAQPSAVAEPPAMLRQESHETVPDVIDCGTFSVTFDFDERLFGIARFQNGVLVSDSDHMYITGTLINSTTLKTLNVSQDFTLTFKPPNTQLLVGLFLKFSLPHGGVVSMAVGKFTVDNNGNVILVAGRPEVDDTQKICAALE